MRPSAQVARRDRHGIEDGEHDLRPREAGRAAPTASDQRQAQHEHHASEATGRRTRRGGQTTHVPVHAEQAQPPQLVGDGGGFFAGGGHEREAQTADLVPEQVQGFLDEDGVGGQEQRLVESAEVFVDPLRRRPASPALTSRAISASRGPTTWLATQMPPRPPIFSTSSTMSSLPA